MVNDPRADNPYGKSYTVDCLGNVVGGQKTVYINLKTEELIKYTAESIKNNEVRTIFIFSKYVCAFLSTKFHQNSACAANF